MKTLTVRLPDALAARIESESRRRHVSKSDIVRERLERSSAATERSAALDDISDLVGSVEDDLPADLSSRKKFYLRQLIVHGRKPRR